MKIDTNPNVAYDVILVAGQSNASGTGLGETDNPWVKDDRIHILTNEFDYGFKKTAYGNVYIDIKVSDDVAIQVADERVEKKDNLRYANFYLWFAKEYADKYLKDGRKVLLVETAVGGTGFKGGHWGENDLIFKRMLEMTDCALNLNEQNKLVAILWHQGEHDAYENRDLSIEDTDKYYKENLDKLLQIVRGRYGNSVPFICAGFAHTFVDEYPKHCKIVMERLEKTCEQINDARYIETYDLQSNMDIGVKGDSAHFTRQALEILGKRYFKKYQDIIDKK